MLCVLPAGGWHLAMVEVQRAVRQVSVEGLRSTGLGHWRPLTGPCPHYAVGQTCPSAIACITLVPAQHTMQPQCPLTP